MAARSVEHVDTVRTDMDAHTVTVSFDDEKTELSKIVSALNEAGYVVKDSTKIE